MCQYNLLYSKIGRYGMLLRNELVVGKTLMLMVDSMNKIELHSRNYDMLWASVSLNDEKVFFNEVPIKKIGTGSREENIGYHASVLGHKLTIEVLRVNVLDRLLHTSVAGLPYIGRRVVSRSSALYSTDVDVACIVPRGATIVVGENLATIVASDIKINNIFVSAKMWGALTSTKNSPSNMVILRPVEEVLSLLSAYLGNTKIGKYVLGG